MHVYWHHKTDSYPSQPKIVADCRAPFRHTLLHAIATTLCKDKRKTISFAELLTVDGVQPRRRNRKSPNDMRQMGEEKSNNGGSFTHDLL
jgi:hypothetical protein